MQVAERWDMSVRKGKKLLPRLEVLAFAAAIVPLALVKFYWHVPFWPEFSRTLGGPAKTAADARCAESWERRVCAGVGVNRGREVLGLVVCVLACP